MPDPVTTRAEACQRIAAHLRALKEMGVASIRLFGSIARDELSPSSDVDILVEFDRPAGAFQLLDVEERLEFILGRPVDLVTPGAIKPRMRERILVEVIEAVP